MANNLVTDLAKNKETFLEARKCIYNLLQQDKDKLLKVESSHEDICIKYYFYFLETKGINLIEAMVYYSHTQVYSNFNALLKITVLQLFETLEKKEPLDFNLF